MISNLNKQWIKSTKNMRKEFCNTIEKLAIRNKKILFLTGDLGFMALENIQKAIGDRFINVGVSEQNMVSMAAGLASEGFTVLCYSIAPFVVFRPAEQIRLDICLHNMDVKIIGNGGGYGYGIMGSTHHAIEDIAVLSSFQNMRCYIPFCAEDTAEITKQMMNRRGPAYIRLGKGTKPDYIKIPKYNHTRKILNGNKLTIVSMGPISLNAIKAIESLSSTKNIADLFVVSEIPIIELTKELVSSIKKTNKLLVIEEHVSRGGLGENLSLQLMKNSITPKRFSHLYAVGYPDGLYGNQEFHQQICKIDPKSIQKTIKKIIDG
jgi:transketolase